MRLRGMALMLLGLAALPALGQETMSFEAVQGAWYGWLAGTGMEVKVAAMPDGAVAYLKTVQADAQPFLQEMRPSIEGQDLVLSSMQAPQPFTMTFHFEGKILFGVFDDGVIPYTVALARAMPDVEALFAMPAPSAAETPMQSIRADARRTSSAENLRQLGAGFRRFAENSQGNVYPPLSGIPGMFAPDAESIYPTYVSDASLFVAAGHPDAAQLRRIAVDDPLAAIDDNSYWYLGYLVPNDDIARTYLAGYAAQARASDTAQFGATLKSGGVEMPRLKLGVEQLLVTNLDDPAEAAAIAARIPVTIERPGIQEGGSNVLFLDGHVEFLAYPGPFPMTQAFMEGLQTLEEQLSPAKEHDEQDDPASGRP